MLELNVVIYSTVYELMRTIGFYSLKAIGLIGFIAGYIMLTVLNPHPVKDFKQFSQYYGLFTVSSIIIEARSVDDLPFRDVVSPMLGKIGQMVLAGIMFTFLLKFSAVLLASR